MVVVVVVVFVVSRLDRWELGRRVSVWSSDRSSIVECCCCGAVALVFWFVFVEGRNTQKLRSKQFPRTNKMEAVTIRVDVQRRSHRNQKPLHYYGEGMLGGSTTTKLLVVSEKKQTHVSHRHMKAPITVRTSGGRCPYKSQKVPPFLGTRKNKPPKRSTKITHDPIQCPL